MSRWVRRSASTHCGCCCPRSPMTSTKRWRRPRSTLHIFCCESHPQCSCGPPLSRELTREKHERLFIGVEPSLAADLFSVGRSGGTWESQASLIRDYLRSELHQHYQP